MQKDGSFLRQRVICLLILLNNPRFLQFAQPLGEDAGRHRITAVLQGSKASALIPQFPQNTQGPSASKQVKERHDRTPRLRSPDGLSRFRQRHLITSCASISEVVDYHCYEIRSSDSLPSF